MWIMLAGPYRRGATSDAERQRNLLAVNRAAYEVFRKGHIPIIGVNLRLPPGLGCGLPYLTEGVAWAAGVFASPRGRRMPAWAAEGGRARKQ